MPRLIFCLLLLLMRIDFCLFVCLSSLFVVVGREDGPFLVGKNATTNRGLSLSLSLSPFNIYIIMVMANKQKSINRCVAAVVVMVRYLYYE